MASISAVGDVRVFRDNPESFVDDFREYFQSMDISFCQSESVYSDKGSEGSSGRRGASPRDLRGYPAFAGAGFDVVSLASNHTMDWGKDALLDCLARMRNDGMQTIGAGKDLAEARTPAFFDKDGARIAFLGYCSVAPIGYYAVPGRAGVAPMRAVTHYEPLEEDQPGTPCEVMTWPVQHDLEALLDDVRSARKQADVVLVSLHWGIHFAPAMIADYQPTVAHAAIDAGADGIIGHHPHILKGIEIYCGKPIFYSLGNFCLDTDSGYRPTDHFWRNKLKAAYGRFGSTPYEHRGDDESNYSMVARIDVNGGVLERVSFRPVVIENHTPRMCSAGDPRGADVARYVREITEHAGFDTSFRIEDDDVVIELNSQPLSPDEAMASVSEG
jgi:hypothetical protein